VISPSSITSAGVLTKLGINLPELTKLGKLSKLTKLNDQHIMVIQLERVGNCWTICLRKLRLIAIKPENLRLEKEIQE
jgi:hypothetical protein